ncbi:MAG: DUF2288 domain-containing protein [Gammaproteobacteria bacterium]
MSNEKAIPPEKVERYKINAETGRLPWKALEKYFANGSLILVAPQLDLVDVAYEFSTNNVAKTKLWLEEGSVAKVTDTQAVTHHEANSEFWVVVVRPWVLAQVVGDTY